jgi:hypothetical protein
MKLLERDSIPRGVAVEMLCNNVHKTNKERKMFRAALENHYVSEIAKKPRSEQIAFRLRRCTITQLAKWLKRTKRRHASVQRVYSKTAATVSDLPEGDKLRARAERTLFALRVAGGALEESLSALEDEQDRREAAAKAAHTLSKVETSEPIPVIS